MATLHRNTLFSMTTRHTVTKTELFSWDFCLRANSCKECIKGMKFETVYVTFFHPQNDQRFFPSAGITTFIPPRPGGIQANTRHRPYAGYMLGQRRRRWPSIEPRLGKCLVSAGIYRLRDDRGHQRSLEVTRCRHKGNMEHSYFIRSESHVQFTKLFMKHNMDWRALAQ